MSRPPTSSDIGSSTESTWRSTPDALIPRPETELLVDEALRAAGNAPCVIADVGTGCGAVAIALATRLPEAVRLRRSTPRSAHWRWRPATSSRLRLAASFSLLHGDLLDPLPEPVDLIVANLPYVKSSDWEALPPEIRDHEPREALDGGPDGTRALERLLRDSPPHLRPGGKLLAEIGWDEARRLAEIARECFPEALIDVKKDIAGLDRILVIAT